eukprot:CAMPEP_0202813804 /NCGR_PEP_ID=MMETSP1389-20130828/5066_1 /ASSEMBLY_ACC=CAM_ASM_000865 /TAXON_ID=302021 /ORGANISM="Rhodomonas sp., Strain CCMP768" /LENGTH=104 /DNA_ID=CAMNT_0049485453 /DNA_START=594 /DNA_END=908 /DNA_ORIENTATION=-
MLVSATRLGVCPAATATDFPFDRAGALAGAFLAGDVDALAAPPLRVPARLPPVDAGAGALPFAGVAALAFPPSVFLAIEPCFLTTFEMAAFEALAGAFFFGGMT